MSWRTKRPSVLPFLHRKLPESLEHMAFVIGRDSVLHGILEETYRRCTGYFTIIGWSHA
jgi:hypothetical protein